MALFSGQCTARADDSVCVSLAAPESELHPELLATFDELLARKGARRGSASRGHGCTRQLLLELAAAPHTVTVHAEAAPADGVVVDRRVARDPSPAVFRETLAHAMYGAVSAWLEPRPAALATAVESAPAASAPVASVPAASLPAASVPAASVPAASVPAASPPGPSAPAAAPSRADAPLRTPSPASPTQPEQPEQREQAALARSERRAALVHAGAGVGGVWWSGAAPDARIFGALALVLPGRFAPQVALRAGVTLPRRADPSELPVRRWSSFGRLAAGARAFSWGRYELRALGMLGIDVLAVTPAHRSTDYVRSNRAAQTLPSVGALTSLHVALSARTQLALELGLDVALRRLKYVARADTDTLFYATPRLLPYAQLVVSFMGLAASRPATEAGR